MHYLAYNIISIKNNQHHYHAAPSTVASFRGVRLVYLAMLLILCDFSISKM